MIIFVVFLNLLVICSSHNLLFPTLKEGTYTCLACTIGVGEIKRWSDYYSKPIADIFKLICDILPSKYKDECKKLVDLFGPEIIHFLEEDLSPDDTCRKLGLCKGFEQCTLYDMPKESKKIEMEEFKDTKFRPNLIIPLLSILSYFETPNGDPGPIPTENDDDGDYFATGFYDRGSAWRGKDCDDTNKNIYPGKKVAMDGVDPKSDFNCNGIAGLEPNSGKPYEEVLCGGIERRGMVVIGDSACAHFRIPPQLLWENVTGEMLAEVMPLVMLEADWPMMGSYGGYQNDSSGLTPGKVSSLYLKLRDLNKCNHRDYQTTCVNGASSNKMFEQVKAMTRDPTTDHPVMFFINSIGDDVCHQEEGFQRITTPEKFHDNIIEILDFLNSTHAPPNSHVVFIGLVQGELLYHYLWNRTHPLGMTYEKVYSYMICTKANPCWGWLNPNDTIRQKTQTYADKLSAVYPQIMKEKSYSNFKMHYIDLVPLTEQIVSEWLDSGHDILDLIEPFDGFHPGQQFQAILADKVYEILMKEDPKMFGDSNPNNDLITKLFGDQGGY